MICKHTYTCECGNKISKRARQCKSCSNRKRGTTEETRKKMSDSQMGSKNTVWKGNSVGYRALHQWVNRRLEKPEFCEECNSQSPLDLANKGVYNRDLRNWEYLCRQCHMIKDGRMNNLKQYKGEK